MLCSFSREEKTENGEVDAMDQMIATAADAFPSAHASALSSVTANAPPTITDARPAVEEKLVCIRSHKADEAENNQKP